MPGRDAVVALVGGVILLAATLGVFLREGIPPAPTPPEEAKQAETATWTISDCALVSALVPVDRAAAQALVPKPFVVSAAASAPDGTPAALLMLDAYACRHASVANGTDHAATFGAAFLAIDPPPGNLSAPGVASYAFALASYTDDAALRAQIGRLGGPVENATITATLGAARPAASTGSLGITSANASVSASGAGASADVTNASRQRVFFATGEGAGYLDANVTLAQTLLGPATLSVEKGPFASLAANAKGAALVGGTFALEGRFVRLGALAG